MTKKTNARDLNIKFIHQFKRSTRTEWPDKFRVCWFFEQNTLDYIYEHKDECFVTNGVGLSDALVKQIPEGYRKKYFEAHERCLLFLLFEEKIVNFINSEFVDSDEFAAIPNIEIFSRLWSRSLSDSFRKCGIEGDYNDIEFLSVYMPYCDVIATDNYMKALTQSLKLDEKHKCRLFSMKGNGLTEMSMHLEDLRKNMQPGNQSLFSVLATMTEEKPTYLVKFLQKLSLARGKFQGTGKYWDKEIYTEVFLLYPQQSEVKTPSHEDVRRLGPRAFTPQQWSEFLIFGYGFRKLINKDKKSVKEIIRGIQEHLRGAATAVVSDDSKFDEDMRKHDSYLFYDIEEAIENKLEHTKRYNILIVYP